MNNSKRINYATSNFDKMEIKNPGEATKLDNKSCKIYSMLKYHDKLILDVKIMIQGWSQMINLQSNY